MVWPTRKETIQMSLIVIAMVFIIALVLWGFDLLLSVAVKALIG